VAVAFGWADRTLSGTCTGLFPLRCTAAIVLVIHGMAYGMTYLQGWPDTAPSICFVAGLAATAPAIWRLAQVFGHPR